MAAYRDDAGYVHAVSPICGHMGCVVSWNSAERTWDCPCHGSLYNFDGHAVQGPTVRDLEPKAMEFRTAEKLQRPIKAEWKGVQI